MKNKPKIIELKLIINKRIPYVQIIDGEEFHGICFSIRRIEKINKPEEINLHDIYLKFEVDKNKIKLVKIKSQFFQTDLEEIKKNHTEMLKEYVSHFI